jgi:hypothetical protein
MAYELGTNVFNMALPSSTTCEHMKQSDTNRFIQVAYPHFAPNGSQDESAVGSYGDLDISSPLYIAPHEYFDLQAPHRPPVKLQPLAPPQNAYYSNSGKQGAPFPIYIGKGINPAQCTSDPAQPTPAKSAPPQ